MTRGRPDFSPTAVDVVLRPEWAAKEGADKTFYNGGVALAYDEGVLLTYVVPAGKTLYITLATLAIRASVEADADNNQIAALYLMDYDYNVFGVAGGNGGIVMPFTRPARYDAGETMRLSGFCDANHDCDVDICAYGYEV